MVGKPIFVVPFLYNLNIAEEDGMGVERKLAREQLYNDPPSSKTVVVVICYPHISMTEDLLPLETDDRFQVEWRQKCLPRRHENTVVILPGSRQTRSDLQWLMESPWKDYLIQHVQAGGRVLGLCGGYQMLGEVLVDETGVEAGDVGSSVGLGFLPMETRLEAASDKVIRPVSGEIMDEGIPVQGFEIHCGQTQVMEDRTKAVRPLLRLEDGQKDGLFCGSVYGTYLHGILRSRRARSFLLLGCVNSGEEDSKSVDPLDRLASHLESCGLNYETLHAMLYR